ncbi:MAG TPA: family 78 glycoside hydrolase catalytic domain [Acidobacteriaceae bacterium]|nr:family 78 glycoside hydrolase catalytic domain [Acidobacteriaceae bacterium]
MISRRKLLSSSAITTLLCAVPRRIRGSLALNHADSATELMQVSNLKCEYRVNPEGIDVLRPRLFWQLHSSRRGEHQTAYRILAASNRSLLKQGQADLWDSGRVLSDQTVQIEYGGLPLGSRQECFWKVMTWDKDGKRSRWSDTASWTMGLLRSEEWQGKWIGDRVLADPANRPLTPIHCYRSQLARGPNVEKWITIDLGSTQRVDSVDIIPARPEKLQGDFRTVMYPLRFKVEAASDQQFSDGRTVVDRTDKDFVAPRKPHCQFSFEPVEARYIKLTVTRLAKWDGTEYGVALGGFGVYDAQTCLSRAAGISCSDSIESSDYSQSYLKNSESEVELSPDSKAVTVEFPGVPTSHTVSRVPMLRRELILNGPIRRARLFVTARGFYEFYINGTRIGDQVFTPGYTDYAKRIEYQAYDVTHNLKQGANALGALLGYGWYAGHMNLHNLRCIDGFFPLLLAQLEVDLADGRRVTIVTDEKWKAALSGPILWSDLLDGEACDFRKEIPGWNAPNFNDSNWKTAYSEPRDEVPLVWARCQPVRRVQENQPVSVREARPNVFVYDFGQEISGYCRLKINNGAAGTIVRLRHAERVDADGMIDVRSLWGVAAQDNYILDGKSDRVLEPHFTYHGFRYVEVTGLAEAPTKDALSAIWLHSDLETVGEFSCSNDLFNKIMDVAGRTQHNLLFDVPAACAGRSERFAWLGDIRPCIQTAIFNMDAGGFFTKYTIDIRDDQTADGRYCDITPHDSLRGTDGAVGAPGWADAGVSLPWQVYVNYGDRRILQEHYASARRWVEFVRRNNPDFLWKNARGHDWGDWLSAGTPSTPKEVGSTAFFAHSADLVSKMAAGLGHDDDAARYSTLFEQIKRAFAEAYVASDGRIANNAQGCYALALHFNLLDEPLRTKSVKHLTEAIGINDYHPTTGFWSSTELLLALSGHGAHSEASRMVNTRTMPSWGFMAENGTTFWESFDAINHNQSLCHWTHSGVAEWLWRNVAGLNPDQEDPGYRSMTIRPRPTKEVSSCRARYLSIRGPIEIEWGLRGREFWLDLVLPVGAKAKVLFPVGDEGSIIESGTPAKKASGVEFLSTSSNGPAFEVESGRYHFTTSYEG